MGLFTADRAKYRTLAGAWVTPEPLRCVQCGVCSFNCPMGIDVRRHVWRVEPVVDSACLTCSECVRRCPRGLLRFESITDAQGQPDQARPEPARAPQAPARSSGRGG